MHKSLEHPKIVEKPWGREVWYAHEAEYAGKILEVAGGHSLSLQKHERKKETMYLFRGHVTLQLNGAIINLTEGMCVTIRPGDVHRVEALEDAVILEVSTPELDDLIRIEDMYGRS